MQTSYQRRFEVSRAGALADQGLRDVVSKVSDTAVPFGVLVVQDFTDDNKVALPGAATDISNADKPVGVALATHALENSESGDPQYPAETPMNILHKGRVYVTVEEAVTPDSPVFVRFAAGAGGTQLGAFRTTADTATAEQLANARFKTSAGAGELAVLELDL